MGSAILRENKITTFCVPLKFGTRNHSIDKIFNKTLQQLIKILNAPKSFNKTRAAEFHKPVIHFHFTVLSKLPRCSKKQNALV